MDMERCTVRFYDQRRRPLVSCVVDLGIFAQDQVVRGAVLKDTKTNNKKLQ